MTDVLDGTHRDQEIDPAIARAMDEAVKRGYVERQGAGLASAQYRLTAKGGIKAEELGHDPMEPTGLGAVLAWIAWGDR